MATETPISMLTAATTAAPTDAIVLYTLTGESFGAKRLTFANLKTALAIPAYTAGNGIAIDEDNEISIEITDGELIPFGGSTNGFPGLKNSGPTLQARLADGSADAPFSCDHVIIGNNSVYLVAASGKAQAQNNSGGNVGFILPAHVPTGSGGIGYDGAGNVVIYNADGTVLIANDGSGNAQVGTLLASIIVSNNIQAFGTVQADESLSVINTTFIPAPSGYASMVSHSGIMSVINDGESAALPITRTVGTAFYSSGGTIPPGGSTFNITITGVLATDTVIANLFSQAGFMGGGGLVIAVVAPFNGGVTVVVANTDLSTSFTCPNIIISAFR